MDDPPVPPWVMLVPLARVNVRLSRRSAPEMEIDESFEVGERVGRSLNHVLGTY